MSGFRYLLADIFFFAAQAFAARFLAAGFFPA
jgi:hypothetical protein